AVGMRTDAPASLCAVARRARLRAGGGMDRPAATPRLRRSGRLRASVPGPHDLVAQTRQQSRGSHGGSRVRLVSRHAVGTGGVLAPWAACAAADLASERQALLAPSGGGDRRGGPRTGPCPRRRELPVPAD